TDPAAIPPVMDSRAMYGVRPGRLPVRLKPARGAERSAVGHGSQLSKDRPCFRGSAGRLGVLLPGELEVPGAVPVDRQPGGPRPDLRYNVRASYPDAVRQPDRVARQPGASAFQPVSGRPRQHDHLNLSAGRRTTPGHLATA